jgi:phage/plasmid-associated DNA primase
LDADVQLLNTATGVVALQDNTQIAHDARYLMTHQSPAQFTPGARSALWEKFLNDVTGGDFDLQKYLQRVIGYCLTGHTREKCFFFIYGPKDTGKSVFIDVISTMMGTYALKVCRKLDLMTGIGATSAIDGIRAGATRLRQRRSDRNKWMRHLSSFDVSAILS